MVNFPNAKINIGLQITGKRSDGFHNLQTIFYPIALTDAFEMMTATSAKSTGVNFQQSGISIDGNITDNICIKAYHLLKKDFPVIPAVEMQLHKKIPVGAGLGGGSSDAAHVLRLMNTMYELELSEQALSDYALELGSDCPFFIKNKPVYATGRGELLEDIELSLANYRILLVHPPIHINTSKAFAGLEINTAAHCNLKTTILQPPETWQHLIINDFETSIFKTYPEIAEIKRNLYEAGAIYASMSGSGSAVFGIFSKAEKTAAAMPAGYFSMWV